MTKFDPELLRESLEGLFQSSGGLSEVSASSFASTSTSVANKPSPPVLSLVIGLSGGVDSIVLLHALSSLVSSATNSDVKVRFNLKLSAIHINHQLHSQANDWQSFCITFCQKLNIPIQCVSVDASPKMGEGPEAAARNARYAAFKKNIHDDDILLTGHHLDDQIETVFLKILRGTGVDGAAGIREISRFSTINKSTYLVRPLLMFSRESIELYASENKLEWVNDPSNDETHYDRNYLRHDVLPVLEKRWPSYRQTVCRFSQHMRQTSDLLKQISEDDFSDAFNVEKKCLNIENLNNLSLPRANNLIRHWVSFEGYSLPSDAQLSQINTAITSREDSSPVVSWANVELRRFKNNLYLMSSDSIKIPEDLLVNIKSWKEGQRVNVPGYGLLELRSSKGDGINKKYFSSHEIKIKFRQGGEKCKPVCRDKTQTLKKIFQEMNLAPWLRDTTPIVYIENEIAAVVGEFYCVPFAASLNEEGLIIARVSE